MRRAALLLAGVARARMPASWYAYGDAAPAGGGGLVATGGDGCSVTIDTSRTQEWNGGFQIYIVVPQWVEGSVAALCCSCFARRYVFRRRHVRLQTDEYGGKEGRRRGRRDRRSVELLRVPRRR